ncbi:dienelactone hydrolase family protein [Sphingorhabdus lacus]|uniref:dienelactone hydrolase family protein n=1 Tax=Sphingorhabdus lacus TaxID=392610 RepID=UPI0031B6316A
MGDIVKINALDEDALFDAYIATPAAAIVVIPEIVGVNQGIRQKYDKLAIDGYLAIAPTYAGALLQAHS